MWATDDRLDVSGVRAVREPVTGQVEKPGDSVHTVSGWSKMAAAPCVKAKATVCLSGGWSSAIAAPTVSGGALTVRGNPGSLEGAEQVRWVSKELSALQDGRSSPQVRSDLRSATPLHLWFLISISIAAVE